jgi:hypothetical protein
LPHLDANTEMRREIANQLAKVDASFGGVIENEPGAIEQLFHPRQLHGEAALPNLHQTDALRFLLALLMFEPGDDILARRPAHDLQLGTFGRAFPRRKFMD